MSNFTLWLLEQLGEVQAIVIAVMLISLTFLLLLSGIIDKKDQEEQ